jgi:hypothetical protein
MLAELAANAMAPARQNAATFSNDLEIFEAFTFDLQR